MLFLLRGVVFSLLLVVPLLIHPLLSGGPPVFLTVGDFLPPLSMKSSVSLVDGAAVDLSASFRRPSGYLKSRNLLPSLSMKVSSISIFWSAFYTHVQVLNPIAVRVLYNMYTHEMVYRDPLAVPRSDQATTAHKLGRIFFFFFFSIHVK